MLGYGAALLHTLNHALFKSLLFLGAGVVHRETGTRDMELLGGLARRLPVTWMLFVIGAAAIVGLPPLNGFVSEWLVYRTLLGAGGSTEPIRLAVLAVPALALVGGLALACFAKVCGVVFLGNPRSARAVAAREPGALMRVPAIALAVACAVIGLAPFVVIPSMLLAGTYVAGTPVAPADASALGASAGMWQLTAFAASVALIGLAAVVVQWWMRRRVGCRESDTWGCGFTYTSPRMQYTASSFAAPLIDVFGPMSGVRAHRGATVFHSEPFDLVLDRAVTPAWDAIRRAAIRLRRLQHGRLRHYLLYVIATITMLLAYLLATGRSR